MENLKNSFKELVEKQSALKKQYREEGKKLFSVLVKEFFDKFGDEVKAFAWTQYTPYFNDGEPCTFGINDIWHITNKAYERIKTDEERDLLEESIYEWDECSGDDDNKLSENANAIFNEITTFIYQNDEIIQELFGDGVQVTCTKEGIETQDHEHD